MKPHTLKKLGRRADPSLGQRRCEEILEAAIKLFARHGYSQTDTQVLADELGVAKGTLYRYFPSKEALFLAAADRVMRKMRERIDASIAGIEEPLERIAEALYTYLSFFAENPDFVELLMQERAQFKDRKEPTYFKHRKANLERWRTLYLDMMAQDRVRKMPVERITDVFSQLAYGTMFINYFTSPTKSPREQAQDILDIVFNGILTQTERNRRQGKVEGE
jgi:AcrR family transcriptional regulator